MIRTDLAVEAHEMTEREGKELRGVKVKTTEHGSIKRTVVDILDAEGAAAVGKDIGRYVTIEAPQLKYSIDDYETVCGMLAEELRAMSGSPGKTLVVGLGNRAITPDALGDEAVKQLIITSHIKKYMPEAFDKDFADVCAIVPGVMGSTGVETAELVKGAAGRIKPDLIIAVDALAGADMSRVCSTVQITDTGIAPGSGVGNHRDGINRESLGCKVIAVGVPTVIAAELLSGDELAEEFKGIMVTTKDIDLVIARMAKTVANGINKALHRNLTFREIEEFVG
ncbi:MAG: GPR endopeptidase [Clostridiales bacterium]|nr:GPR endopeptidase [Clostridiales bacterium]